MTYTISKTFTFAASHQLDMLPIWHQCSRLHGHNYRVVLSLASDDLDKTGFVFDFGDLKRFKLFIDAHLDHRHLNDALDFNPTAENVAKFLYDVAAGMFEQVNSVAIWETDSSCALYQP